MVGWTRCEIEWPFGVGLELEISGMGSLCFIVSLTFITASHSWGQAGGRTVQEVGLPQHRAPPFSWGLGEKVAPFEYLVAGVWLAGFTNIAHGNSGCKN